MAERKKAAGSSKRQLTIRHRSRIQQTGIFFMKFLRLFLYQRDWIVLPISALVGGIVGFVISSYFMVTMEGTMTGAFVLVCICVWTGSFNSIQVVCREREVVKREHRSGMHISAYIAAHMLYQFLLCVLQTIIILVATYLVGIRFPNEGMFTRWFIVDFGITILLITYAADMLSLFISTLARTTTAAMTVMPFMLVCQLIFSGGMIPLPAVVKPLTKLTVACPGFYAMASQTDTNSKPYASTSAALNQIDGVEFEVTITVGQILDLLRDTDNESIRELRDSEISMNITIEQVLDELITSDKFSDLRNERLVGTRTVGNILLVLKEAEFMDKYRDMDIAGSTTLGELIDYLSEDKSMAEFREKEIVIETTIGDAMKIAGKKEIKKLIRERATEMNYHEEYECSKQNILFNWLHLLLFIVGFAFLSTISLEFIDRDKR